MSCRLSVAAAATDHSDGACCPTMPSSSSPPSCSPAGYNPACAALWIMFSQVQHLALVLVELHKVHASPLSTTQCGAIGRLQQCTLDPTIHITYKDVKLILSRTHLQLGAAVCGSCLLQRMALAVPATGHTRFNPL